MKKKVLSIVLTLAMTIGMGTTAFAETRDEDGGSTVLTATIPVDYEVTVPGTFALVYGNSAKQTVATLTATNVNDTKIQMLSVGATYTDLINVADPDDKIALEIYGNTDLLLNKETGKADNGSIPTLYYYYEGHVYSYSAKFDAMVTEEEWSKATPGATYQATMNYIFRVDTF